MTREFDIAGVLVVAQAIFWSILPVVIASVLNISWLMLALVIPAIGGGVKVGGFIMDREINIRSESPHLEVNDRWATPDISDHFSDTSPSRTVACGGCGTEHQIHELTSLNRKEYCDDCIRVGEYVMRNYDEWYGENA